MTAEPLAADAASQVPLLSAVAPFSELPDAVVGALAAHAQDRRYLAGETLLAPGQFDGAEFYFVMSGRLKAAYLEPARGAMMIDTISRGGFFGLAEALAEETSPRTETATLTAETDAAVAAFDAAAVRGLAAQRPSLSRAFMTFLARALLRAGVQAAPEDASPERRIFAALLSYVERDAVEGCWRVTKMPRHRELADKAGVDEASAAAAVARLIQSGVARREYPGLVIEEIAQLNRLAG
jgi:CRP-like cAMP-binding protein